MAVSGDPVFYPISTAEGAGTTGTKKQQSAAAIIGALFEQQGLSGLGDWIWQQVLDGKSTEEIYLMVRERPEYKARFPAMEEMSSRGTGMTETQYIAYENEIKDLLHRYQVPGGMYDTPDSIAKLMLSNVSPAEASERLTIAANAAYNAPTEVKNALYERGVRQGDMVGYYLDPDKATPYLEQQYRSAQVSGAAAIQGLGVAISDADRLAAQGVSFDDAVRGFGQVASTVGLGGALGEAEVADQGQRVAAAFGDANATTQVSRVIAGRQAKFADQGGAAADQEGITGLGK